MKNYHQNENISQTAAIRYQRQLRLCILLVAIDTILQLILSFKYKKWSRDGKGREMNPPDIVMYKTFIILSAGAKLSVMLFNVTTLFFHYNITQLKLVFCISEWNGVLIISEVRSTYNGLSWGWWLVFSIAP